MCLMDVMREGYIKLYRIDGVSFLAPISVGDRQVLVSSLETEYIVFYEFIDLRHRGTAYIVCFFEWIYRLIV